jgi:hypothetical protein
LMIAATQKIEIMSSYRDSLLSSMHPPKWVLIGVYPDIKNIDWYKEIDDLIAKLPNWKIKNSLQWIKKELITVIYKYHIIQIKNLSMNYRRMATGLSDFERFLEYTEQNWVLMEESKEKSCWLFTQCFMYQNAYSVVSDLLESFKKGETHRPYSYSYNELYFILIDNVLNTAWIPKEKITELLEMYNALKDDHLLK